MTPIDPVDRARIATGFMRFVSRERLEIAVPKDDLKLAIAYTDTWLDNNAASYNSGLPATVKAMSPAFKALLLAIVAIAKFSLNKLILFVGGID